MNATKKARVDTIRANTAYPAYRGLIGIITVILMILAGLQVIGALALGVAAGSAANNGFVGFVAVLLGLAFAALAFFLAKIWNEAAQILVDIGDSVLDANPTASAVASPSVTHAAMPAATPAPLQG